MRLVSLFLAALVLGLVLVACNSKDAKLKAPSASPTPAAHNDGVRRITTVEVRDLLAKGEAIVVDVRTEPAYKEGHVKGARLIPLTQILSKSGELPQDKLIVTYCSCSAEQTSVAAAVNLKTKGITNTAALLGGYEGWKKAGFPVESGVSQ